MGEQDRLFLFLSTHDAIRAEQVLITAGYKPQVVPVPRRISSDCGIAIRLEAAMFDDAKAVLDDKGVRIANTVDASDVKNI